ncbi:MAG TPA: DinB family protein [Rhodothermales bacterium]|nr:DinB family protein [Rhodothermales bacterium]
MMASPIHPYLESLAMDAAVVSAYVQELKWLSLAQLQWKPSPSAWSILECAEHLVLTARAYHPVLAEAIATAERGSSDTTYSPTLLGRLFIKAVSPDPKLKVKTLESVTPARSGLSAAVLDNLLSVQTERRALLEQTAGVDINRVKIRSPLNRFLRLSAGEAFTVLIRHEERHLQQADRVRGHEGFPATNG